MSHLKISRENSIQKITLNRPKVRNAFDEQMISQMTQAFRDLSGDDEVRAVLLTGEGESFCAGGDLNWMKSMVNFSKQENIADSEKLYEMYQALADIPVPVVCFVHGHVMGGGLGLVAASDICFAEKDTKFAFSEVRLGLAPAVISDFVIDKVMPRDISRFFLTAEVFDAAQAYDMGLIHGFGERQEMQEKSHSIAKKITNNGPRAVRETKSLIGSLRKRENHKKTTTELIAFLRAGAEGQEGLKAFFEKRKPNWLES